ncbi:MAG: histidine phosphatase family protein [Patescibacteria group bacterium]
MYQNPYIKLKPATRKPYTEFLLIRHCNPDYTKEKQLGDYNMPLSAAGRKQRGFLTKRLLTLGIDRAYSSGLPRAQETAALYTAKAGQEILIDQRLDEIDWKDWHRIKYFNMSEKTREKKFKHYVRLDRQLDKMQTVARRALADLFRHNRGQRVAVFTHGNFIKALLTGILNADVIGFLSLEIFQSSISKLVIDRDGYVKISYINDVSHLPSPPSEDLFVTLID